MCSSPCATVGERSSEDERRRTTSLPPAPPVSAREGLMNDIKSGVKLRKAADRPARTPRGGGGLGGGGGGGGGEGTRGEGGGESSSVSEIMKRVANIRASMAGNSDESSSDDDW